jgi:hypothetical protein
VWTTFGVWSTARDICSFVTNIVRMPTLRQRGQVPGEMLSPNYVLSLFIRMIRNTERMRPVRWMAAVHGPVWSTTYHIRYHESRRGRARDQYLSILRGLRFQQR